MNAVQMQRKIGARTGGISTAMIYEQPVGPGGTVADPMDVVSYFAVKGKSTGEKAEDLFGLIHALVADANLADGQAKAIELLREQQQALESQFISSGNQFAGMRLAARNSLLGYIGEATQGVTFYESVKQMLKQATDDWPSMLARLETLRDTLLTQEGIIINLTADEKVLEDVQPTIDAFVAKLPAKAAVDPKAAAWKDAVQLLPRENEGFAITTQVNYVAAGARLFEAGEHCPGDFVAVSRFLSRGYLWDNVRVVGGAYGGGCALNPSSGAFAFSSYRDPNLQGTLDIYEKTVEVLEKLEITDDALEQAIVGAVGDMDSPLNAQQKGYKAMVQHLTGVTTEHRQRNRDEILNMNRESFAAFAKRLKQKKLAVAVFASNEALEAANAKRDADSQIKISPPQVTIRPTWPGRRAPGGAEAAAYGGGEGSTRGGRARCVRGRMPRARTTTTTQHSQPRCLCHRCERPGAARNGQAAAARPARFMKPHTAIADGARRGMFYWSALHGTALGCTPCICGDVRCSVLCPLCAHVPSFYF